MNSSIFTALEYLKYRIKADSENSLHSPFIYELYTTVIEPDKRYYVFDGIDKERENLLKNNRIIEIEDISTEAYKQKKKIREIAQNDISQPKVGELLFKIVDKYKPRHILELGTCLGLTTLYLASANLKTKVTTFEVTPSLANRAKETFQRLKRKNITVIQGNLDQTLVANIKQLKDVDLIFFDADRSYKATMRYFKTCLPYIHKDMIFIIDDIYASEEMKQAWVEIKNHPKVRVTVDVFQLGIVLFREKQKREHFTLQF